MKIKNLVACILVSGMLLNPIAVNFNAHAANIGIELKGSDKLSDEAIELLKQMPYYGDISNCKMSKEMAKAYADVLSSMSEYGKYQSYYQPNNGSNSAVLKVCLTDFANDGYPFMLVAYELENKNFNIVPEFAQTGILSSVCDLWGYENGKAVKYDLANMDVSVYNEADDYSYTGASSLETSMCTIDGKPAIRMFQTFGQWEMGPEATQYYIILLKMLSLLNFIRLFIILHLKQKKMGFCITMQLPFLMLKTNINWVIF